MFQKTAAKPTHGRRPGPSTWGRHILPKCQRRFRKPETRDSSMSLRMYLQLSFSFSRHFPAYLHIAMEKDSQAGENGSIAFNGCCTGSDRFRLAAPRSQLSRQNFGMAGLPTKVIWIPTSLVLHSLRPSARCHTDQGGLEFGSG